MQPWPDRENDDAVRIASVHVTVVLTDGTVDTLTIPQGSATDFLSTALVRDTKQGDDGVVMETLHCEIHTSFRPGTAAVYELRRLLPDGTWQTPAGAGHPPR